MIDADPIRVFISSKQKEFAVERQAMCEILESSPLMAPVVAEDFAPERSDVRSRYLADVERCPIYVGLFGCVYSAPTEEEYRHALLNPAREILLYERDCPAGRDEKLAVLIGDMKSRHVPARLDSLAGLRRKFADHLHRAVSRMIRLLLEQRVAPRPQGASTRSPASERWMAHRTQLMALGYPVVDAERLGDLVDQYKSVAEHFKRLKI